MQKCYSCGALVITAGKPMQYCPRCDSWIGGNEEPKGHRDRLFGERIRPADPKVAAVEAILETKQAVKEVRTMLRKRRGGKREGGRVRLSSIPEKSGTGRVNFRFTPVP